MIRIEPKQVRGHEAERKIIEAAQKVFSEKGFSGARVADIIEAAGSSTGNFYYRFKNKEALFNYMLECFVIKVRDALSELEQDTTEFDNASELFYELIRQNAKILSDSRGFYRAINELSIRNPDIWNKLKMLTEETADVMVEQSKPFMSSIKAPEPEKAIRDAIRLITGSLANQAVHYPDNLILDEPKNIDRLYRAAMGILEHYPTPKNI